MNKKNMNEKLSFINFNNIFLNFVSRSIDIGYIEDIWTIYSNILKVEVNFKIRL